MKTIESSPAHCAIRLRAALTQLYRQLRSTQPDAALSFAKLSALGQLYRAGPLTPKDLAERERVKLQSLTRLLAELEAEGCVLRRPHESDGRQTVLSLTRRGAKLLTDDVHRREASLAAAIEHLPRSEREVLLASCAVLERLAESLGGESAQGSPSAEQDSSSTQGRGA